MSKTTILATAAGFVLGVALLGAVGWTAMPGMMLKEAVSPYGLQETVDKISENAKQAGWVVAGVKPLHKSVKKHGGGDVLPVMLVNLCEPHHASSILNQDPDRVVSVMMPCTISVYQKQDGRTYIGYMNAGLLGQMFGGNVAKVMGTVSDQQQGFIGFAL
ncbi:MAG: DUF302 domain-containing protein [Gammaproteobacteria bacterium]|jgi:uncharacterized protein (DUF302 family)